MLDLPTGIKSDKANLQIFYSLTHLSFIPCYRRLIAMHTVGSSIQEQSARTLSGLGTLESLRRACRLYGN